MATTTTNATSATTTASRSLAQLGLGETSGLIKQDVLDKLKAADEYMQLTPFENRLTKNTEKQSGLTSLITYVSAFKANVVALNDQTIYSTKGTQENGSKSVTITSMDSSAKLQNMAFHVNNLATQDSYQSKGFDSDGELVYADLADGEVFEFDLKIGISSFKLSVDNTTTLKDLSKQIDAMTNGTVNSKILDVGGNENPFRLFIQSENTGKDNEISFSAANIADDGSATPNLEKLLSNLGFSLDRDQNTGDLITNPDGSVRIGASDPSNANAGSRIQEAQDARFTYNGISITRSSNEVNDLIEGVTFQLNKVDEDNDWSSITIVNDTNDISSIMSTFVSSYNSLVSALDTLTYFDSTTGETGPLMGVNEVKTMVSQMKKVLTGLDDNNKSLLDFGLSFTEEGYLSLNNASLQMALSSDFDGVKNFFSSITEYNNASVSASRGMNSGMIAGDIQINNVKVSISTKANATAEENAKAIVKAINDADIENIKASYKVTNEAGIMNYHLVIESSNGTSINMTGDDFDTQTMLEQLGFENAVNNRIEAGASSSVTEGFFDRLNSVLNSYIGTNGVLFDYGDNLEKEASHLKTQQEKIQSTLDKKYDLMQVQFAKYEAIMNNLNSQFNAMKSIFDALLNANKK